MIGLPYTINFTDASVPGKEPFVIEPNTTNGPLSPNVASPDSSAIQYNTSIVLPGMGLIQYGERIEESIVHMLEHFASATPPVVPTIGQLWYDTGAKLLKIWTGYPHQDNGREWVPVGSNGVRFASNDEFNGLLADINYVIGVPGGAAGPDAGGATTTTTHGYNQTPMVPVTGRPVSDLEWLRLINLIRKAGGLQGSDVSGLIDTNFVLPGNDAVPYGMYRLMQQYNGLLGAIATIRANRLNINPAALEVDLSGTGTVQRNTAWSGSIEHIARLQFTSDAHARGFFNSGGSIALSGSLDQVVDADDQAFRDLLIAMGTTRMGPLFTTGVSSTLITGFYKLSNVYQTIYAKTEGSNTVTMSGMYDPATYQLTVRVVYTTASTGNGLHLYSYSDGVLHGQITSSITMRKASSQYMNDPEIAFPAITTLKSLN